jgi:hypothetical protein
VLKENKVLSVISDEPRPESAKEATKEMIQMAMSDGDIANVISCKTAKNILTTLRSLYREFLLGGTVRVSKRLFRMKLSSESSIKAHID